MTERPSLVATDIFEGDVLRFGSRDGALFRVVGILSDRAILFEVRAPHHAPLSVLLWSDLEADRTIEFCDDHEFHSPFVNIVLPDRRSNALERVKAILKPLLEMGDELFDELARSAVISAIVNPSDGTKGHDRKTVKRTLDRYWRYGMTIEAAVPGYENIGGPGVKKTRGEKKLGAPRKFGSARGVNITPDLAHNQKGADKILCTQ